MFEQSIDALTHVRGLKQRRRNLADQGVGGTDASLQICSYALLASCVGECCATGEALRKASSLRLKLFVRNNSVNDVPSLEGRGVVLISRINNFACATRARPLS